MVLREKLRIFFHKRRLLRLQIECERLNFTNRLGDLSVFSLVTQIPAKVNNVLNRAHVNLPDS